MYTTANATTKIKIVNPIEPLRLSCRITQIKKATKGITKIAQNIKEAPLILLLLKIHSGQRCNLLADKITFQKFIITAHGNHCRIVCAIFQFRNVAVPVIFRSGLLQ